MVILLLLVGCFLTANKFLKEEYLVCKSFPYISIEHNDTRAFETWNTNITVPDNKALCMGQLENVEQESPFGEKYNTTKCSGDVIGKGNYNVTCMTDTYGYINNGKSITTCRIMYNCSLNRDWKWKIEYNK